MSDRAPLVSVSIATYNHGPYIAQALESVLMQETDFNFEIVIGEDDSQDDTRKICENYASKNPSIIRLFRRDRKNVIYVHGRPTGRYNGFKTLMYCQGKYVALLDGDDVWTDKNKLQKQVNVLENDSSAVACFHNVDTVDENGDLISSDYFVPQKSRFGLRDMVEMGSSYATCSLMFERRVMKNIPKWLNYKISDFVLDSWVSKFGDFVYVDERMASYRIHGEGLWQSNSSFFQKEMKFDYYKLLLNDSFIKEKAQDIVKRKIRNVCQGICLHHVQIGLWKRLKYSFYYFVFLENKSFFQLKMVLSDFLLHPFKVRRS